MNLLMYLLYFQRIERVLSDVSCEVAVLDSVVTGVCNMLMSCASVETTYRRRMARAAALCIQKPPTHKHTVCAIKLLATAFYTGNTTLNGNYALDNCGDIFSQQVCTKQTDCQVMVVIS